MTTRDLFVREYPNGDRNLLVVTCLKAPRYCNFLELLVFNSALVVEFDVNSRDRTYRRSLARDCEVWRARSLELSSNSRENKSLIIKVFSN